ncbi:MAG: hypothetical protein E4H28_08515 [Gemmatimonadales bacterium]|nr:MAG: hypothetical protein E4H28_08515 [Gemmatimonadales bacterium]
MKFGALIAVFLFIPAGANAQETGDNTVIQRETFEYPAMGRRDPFTPLSAGEELGPRFEDLGLSGIIYSPERGSIAVLVDQATLRRYRVWEGDMIGGARLLAVKQTEAEFLVTVFGVSRRDTLRLKAHDKEQGQ